MLLKKWTKIVKYFLLSLLIVIIGIYFISKKENLDIDEIFTYGLANSTFQLNIEDFKDYTGSSLLENYAIPNDINSFNVKNVFFNQKMDTHPPLYYLIINFICSINKNFSIWNGLIINIILLIPLFFELRYLFNVIIKNRIYSTLFSLLSLFLYGFTNLIVFTRMYVMLSVLSMSLIILVIQKSKNNITDNRFLILFFFNLIFGILTQYHFIIIASMTSFFMLIELIKEKKYALIIKLTVVGIISILTSFLLFNGMLNHIFSNASLHSLSIEKSKVFITNLLEMPITLKEAFFGKSIYIYFILLIILILTNIILYFKNKAYTKNNNFSSNNGFTNLNNETIKLYINFSIASTFYFIFICLTATFSFARYLYNIYPLIIIIIISPIYYLSKIISKKLSFIPIILMLVMCIFSKIKNPSSLNIGDELFRNYLLQNKNTKTIIAYNSKDNQGNENTMGGTSKWKLPYTLYLFKDLEHITYIDTSNKNRIHESNDDMISGYEDIILVLFTPQNDEQIINEIKSKNFVSNVNKLYITSYIHVYRLIGS